MNAKPISILQDIEDNIDLVAGQKINGYNEDIVIKGGIIRIFNQSGTEQTENVPHITKIPVSPLLDIVLGGEGYAPSGRVEDAKSIFGSGSVHSLAWQAVHGRALYTAVNIKRFKGEDLTQIPFGERLTLLRTTVQMLNSLGMPITQEVLHPHFKHQLFSQVLLAGGEGVVIKSLRGYENDWFKVKRIKTWDVVIMGFTEAKEGKTGKFKGQIGAIVFGCYNNDGKLIEVGRSSGMDNAQRRDFTDHRESYIGKVVEVKGDGIGNGGGIVFPRFVRMREDKLATTCFLPRE